MKRLRLLYGMVLRDNEIQALRDLLIELEETKLKLQSKDDHISWIPKYHLILKALSEYDRELEDAVRELS